MREIARFLSVILSIYNMLIIVRILLQWLNPMRMQTTRLGISDMLAKVVDPYLNLFKGIKSLQRGRLDFTPLAALIVLNIVQRIIQTFAITGKFLFGYTLATIIQALWWSIGSLILVVMAIIIGVRLFFTYKPTPNALQYIALLDSWLRRPLDTLHSILFRGREVSDRVLLWSALVLTGVSYALCTFLLNLLINWLVKLPY